MYITEGNYTMNHFETAKLKSGIFNLRIIFDKQIFTKKILIR